MKDNSTVSWSKLSNLWRIHYSYYTISSAYLLDLCAWGVSKCSANITGYLAKGTQSFNMNKKTNDAQACKSTFWHVSKVDLMLSCCLAYVIPRRDKDPMIASFCHLHLKHCSFLQNILKTNSCAKDSLNNILAVKISNDHKIINQIKFASKDSNPRVWLKMLMILVCTEYKKSPNRKGL